MLWIGYRQGGLGSSRIARTVVRATVKGNIAVAAIQGTLGREGLVKLIFTFELPELKVFIGPSNH